MSHTPCGLCHDMGWIKEYEETWPCPCCRPQHDFQTLLGLSCMDGNGDKWECWQMVSSLDKKAYAILDFVGDNITRFMFSDSAKDESEEWRESVIALRKIRQTP